MPELSILTWIILGLIAGAIARLLVPGKQPGGLLTTIVLGIAGAVVGGYLGSAITGSRVTGIDMTSILLSAIGAILVLFVWSLIAGKR